MNANNKPNYIIKGPTESKFGSNVARNNLLHRDVAKSPFKNPTNLDNPSPAQYAPKTHELSKGIVSPSKGSPANSGEFFKSPTSSNTMLDIYEDGAFNAAKPTSTY